MANKKFREWMEDEESQTFIKEYKKDSKRYDKKKSDIQRARKQKNKRRETYI